MSSILTNTGAMVALQTLRGINSNLSKTQSDISTGKSIASAKDNSAVWAIAKVMESDVSGFKGISDSLALGASTIAVAASAASKITDLLSEMKQKIVAAQEQNVDREKLQTDISALRGQIGSISGAAQFNGLNMLSTDNGLAAGASIAAILAAPDNSKVSILSSLDRSASGAVTAAHIDAQRADLSSAQHTFGTGTVIAGTALGAAATIATAADASTPGTGTITIAGDTTTAGRQGHAVIAGDSYSLKLGGTAAVEYVAKASDTLVDIRDALFEKLEKAVSGQSVFSVAKGTGATITVTNTSTSTSVAVTKDVKTSGKAAGGFSAINDIDVTTQEGAEKALADIEGMIQTAIKAAAEFGTAQKRVTIQRDFVNSLMDSLKSGIGSLVDADMEESSARLQALQVQQQLGVQALSIANQAPQSILSLFR